MKLLASKQLTEQQDVNSIGKWLSKNIDSAFDFKKLSNTSEFKMTVLYEVPKEVRKRHGLDESYADLNEMTLRVNLTTYQHKIRVNVIQDSGGEEYTLGCLICNQVNMEDLVMLRDKIMNYIEKRLNKFYEGFDFIF